MKAVKSLVVFMGVLLVAGLALLGYGLYTKAGRVVKTDSAATVQATAQRPVAPAALAPVAGSLVAFGEISLSQPAGSKIVSVQIHGSQAVLTVTGGAIGDRVIVVDLAKKVVIGQLALVNDGQALDIQDPSEAVQPTEPQSAPDAGAASTQDPSVPLR